MSLKKRSYVHANDSNEEVMVPVPNLPKDALATMIAFSI